MWGHAVGMPGVLAAVGVDWLAWCPATADAPEDDAPEDDAPDDALDDAPEEAVMGNGGASRAEAERDEALLSYSSEYSADDFEDV